VAREAGLSVSYLYKYPEIKERIEILRKQQLKADKPTTAQKASDNSKTVIIYQLRERIKQLEAEWDCVELMKVLLADSIIFKVLMI